MSRISVIGAGHVGLVTAAGLAELGHCVTCVEVDDIRLAAIARDALPIYEPGLAALVSRHRSSGRLRLTNRYDAAIADSEVVFVSVHTPAGPNGNPDTRFVFAAVRSIVSHASLGRAIVATPRRGRVEPRVPTRGERRRRLPGA